MVIAQVEVRRVSFLACKEGEEVGAVDALRRCTDAEGDEDTVQCFLSLIAPSGIELSCHAALPHETYTGEAKELRVCCATNEDLQDIWFSVREICGTRAELDGDNVTLPCRLWCLKSTARRQCQRDTASDASSCSHHTFSFLNSSGSEEGEENGEDADAFPTSNWQLLAEGRLRFMEYGLQNVELEMDSVAMDRSGAFVSVLFFVAPRLQCTLEETGANLLEQEDDNPPMWMRLEAHESCDPTSLRGIFFSDDDEDEEEEKEKDDADNEEEEEEDLKSFVDSHAAAPSEDLVNVSDVSEAFDVEGAANASAEPLCATRKRSGERDEAVAAAVAVRESDTHAEPQRTKMMVLSSTSDLRERTAARWVLFVDMAPWNLHMPADEESIEYASTGETGNDFCDAAERLWRLTCCKADGHVLACGSSFYESVCSHHGWSDVIVAIDDDILAVAVLSLQLQALLPVEVGDDVNKNKKDAFLPLENNVPLPNCLMRWVPVAVSTQIPVADLLVSSADACMYSVPLYVTTTGNTFAPSSFFPFRKGKALSVQAILDRLPEVVGTSDTTGWMKAQQRVAAQFHEEMSGQVRGRYLPEEQLTVPRCIDAVYSVALHVCFAVSQQLCPHVDMGVAYPFVALTISGGCELLLHASGERKEKDRDDLRRAPVVRFDARVQTTLDKAHSVLLLTLHSPVAPEVVFGRAVLSIFELSPKSTGRLWLPLRSGRELDCETCDGCDPSPLLDPPPVGWIHCSYECIILSEERANSAAFLANQELLQQPLLLAAPLFVPKYFSSSSLGAPLRWNCLRLCIVEAVDFCGVLVRSGRWKQKRGVYARADVLPPPHSASYADSSTVTAAFTTPALVSHNPRWVCCGSLTIAADTTHLIIRLFDELDGGDGLLDGDTAGIGVIDIPRVTNSRFWTTPTGEAWLPLIAPRRGASPCYHGAVFLRWTFSSRDDPHMDVLHGTRTSLCPTWSLSAQTQPHGTYWVHLSCIELLWTWLLHHVAWKASFASSSLQRRPVFFLWLRAGYFMHELPLEPPSEGDCYINVHGAVCLPLTDHVEVAVCCRHDFNFLPCASSNAPLPILSAEDGSKAVSVVGVGELLLSKEDRDDIVAYHRLHRVVIMIEPHVMYPPCSVQAGLLTAQLHIAQIAQQESDALCRHAATRWTWPPPHHSTLVELRLGRVFMLHARTTLLQSSHTPSPPRRWIVGVREKAGGSDKSNSHDTASASHADIIHPPVTLNATAASNVSQGEGSDALYLRWPASPFVIGLRQRPSPPMIELLLSRELANSEAVGVAVTTEQVGSVTLDLPYCFERQKGTQLYAIRHPCASQAISGSGGVIGFVELHFDHNFVQEDVGVEAKVMEAPEKVVGRERVLVITVVKARYRQRMCLPPSLQKEDTEETLTSFVVGVGETSWRTTTQKGMTPQFDCQMLFDLPRKNKNEAEMGSDDVVEIRMQMLPELSISDTDPTRTVGMMLSPPFVTAFAFLRLCYDDVVSAGEMNSGQWVPLYTFDDHMSVVRILVGEVLVRWSWMNQFSWGCVTPMSVCRAPSSANQPANDVPTPPSTRGGDESLSLPPPVYLSLQVCDFVYFNISPLETAQKKERSELFLMVSMSESPNYLKPTTSFQCPGDDHHRHHHLQQQQETHPWDGFGVRYGDRTGGAAFDPVSKRCVWREYCLLPLFMDEGLNLCFEVYCCSEEGSATVVGSGYLNNWDVVGRGITAVAIFALGDMQPCGALTVALMQKPLYRDLMVVSTGQPQERVTESPARDKDKVKPQPQLAGDLKGVKFFQSSSSSPSGIDVPQSALLRITVHSVEVYGQSVSLSDVCWELKLRSDATYAPQGKKYQWTSLDAANSLLGEGHGEEWVGWMCAQNMSTIEISLLRRDVVGGRRMALTGMRDVHGWFVVNFPTHPSGEDSRRSVHVDLLRGAPFGPFNDDSVPVGRLYMSYSPLLYSGVLYDPFTVFFKRTLRLVVTELLGVVRSRHLRSSRLQRMLHETRGVGETEKEEVKDGEHNHDTSEKDARVCMRLQCGTATAVSSLFSPPIMKVSKRNGMWQLDGEQHCETMQFSLLLDCIPVDCEEVADVRLSLHLCHALAQPKQTDGANALLGSVLIGEGVTHLSWSGEKEGSGLSTTTVAARGGASKPAGDAASLWVPIPAVGEKSARTAYAHLHYAWSHEVSLGSWLVCIRIRSLGQQSTLYRPFLFFRVRFPNGAELCLPLDLFCAFSTSNPSNDEGHSAAVATPLRSTWSFSHVQLPVIWPLGAQIESVELHDCVAAGLTIHVGTHRWSSSDTPLLALLVDQNETQEPRSTGSVLFSSERWLRFKGVGTGEQRGEAGTSECVHEVLLARSACPPRGVDATRCLHVPFHWWPLQASLRFTASGSDLVALGAGRLAVSCRLCIGRWQLDSTTATAGWVWERNDDDNEVKADEMFASYVEVEPSTASVTATWGTPANKNSAAAVATGGGGLRRHFSVEELRDGLTRYAVRVSVICRTRCASKFGSESTTPPPASAAWNAGMNTVYTYEGVLIVDDDCTSTCGETRLVLVEGSGVSARAPKDSGREENSIAMAWVIAHEEMKLFATEREDSHAARLCRPSLDAVGKMRRWRQRRTNDVHQKPEMLSWLVTSIEVKKLPVVLTSMPNATVTASNGFPATGFIPQDLPVLIHLGLKRLRRCHSHKTSASLNGERVVMVGGGEGGLRARFSPVSLHARSVNTQRIRPLCTLHVEPMWCISPQHWMDHRRPLNLMLWQELSSSEELSCILGTLRLDVLLRDAAAQRPTRSGGDFGGEVVTDWQPLHGSELSARCAGIVRVRFRPVMHLPREERMKDRQVPVCVEVLEVTAQSFKGIFCSRHGGRLGLMFSPAENAGFSSCSSTFLRRGGEEAKFATDETGSRGRQMKDAAVTSGMITEAADFLPNDDEHFSFEEAARENREMNIDRSGPSETDDHVSVHGNEGTTPEELVALSTFHTILLEGREMDLDTGQKTWFGMDVILVECGIDGHQQEGSSIDCEDIVRVLAAERLDLRLHSFMSCGSTERENPQSLQTSSRAGVAPSLYSAANFTVALSCVSSGVVTVRLHVVILESSPPFIHEGNDTNRNDDYDGEDVETRCIAPRFFFAADGHGKDRISSFGDRVSAVGGKVYRMGRKVYEWDAQELQRVRSSSSSSTAGAVAFSIPRLRCFKWKTVKTKSGNVSHSTALPWQWRYRLGHTTWVYDNRYIMLHGGICVSQVGGRKPPPLFKRGDGRGRRHRGCRFTSCIFNHAAESLVHDASSAVFCYDTKEHSWAVMETEEGDMGKASINGEMVPCQHVFHSNVLIQEKVWCFGGCRVAGKMREDGDEFGDAKDAAWMTQKTVNACRGILSNALKCLDLPTRQWSIVKPMAQMTSRAICPDRTIPFFSAVKTPLMSSSPLPVMCHTAVGWNDQMFVFGGLQEVVEGEGTVLRPSNALYMFHTIRLSWWLLSPANALDVVAVVADDGGVGGGGLNRSNDDTGRRRNWPSARYGHAAAIVPEHPHGAFIVLGGATCLPMNGKKSGKLTFDCALDELLWVYYAAFGYWQRIEVPSFVPLTRRVFSSLQIVRLTTGEPWISYLIVIAGGCDASSLEKQQRQEPHAEEEAIDKKQDTGLSVDANGNTCRGDDISCVSLANGAIRHVFSTVLTSPQLETAWASLEERGLWQVSVKNRT
ncbi:hypothetical protein C3747_137g101 [Trypanosoma cruzi]|uniref:C2 domain-containing protein n=1 Tax=Trypanosoma cruzi TaxID=5693 RepID=A0A2V2WA65_TRYCR|nr:hypothetical protein C3747_137g101 [Trypanosoma cruzi]